MHSLLSVYKNSTLIKNVFLKGVSMNKFIRMNTVFENGAPDCIPAGFWFHFPNEWDAKTTADAHLKLYRETDMDVIKIMDDNWGNYMTKGVEIKRASDWKNINLPGIKCGHFMRMSEIIKRIADAAGGEVMLFPTVWSPFKIASFTYSSNGLHDSDFMADCRDDPESILAGVGAIASVLEDFVAGYFDSGGDGIYFSAQFSEPGRFTDEQWEKLVKPYDLRVINAAKKAGKRAIVHICGEPEFEFRTTPARFAGYPGDMFNWAVHRNDLDLQGGRRMFGAPVMGGMHNRGVLIDGTENQIRAEVRNVIAHAGKKGFMLGADCTVPSDISVDRLRYAVDEAHKA
jgi:uroporphyrinogen decarboxylase